MKLKKNIQKKMKGKEGDFEMTIEIFENIVKVFCDNCKSIICIYDKNVGNWGSLKNSLVVCETCLIFKGKRYLLEK